MAGREFVDDMTREAEQFVDRVWGHVGLNPEQKVYVCEAMQARIGMKLREAMRQLQGEMDEDEGDGHGD
jgi:hypothetical protein